MSYLELRVRTCRSQRARKFTRLAKNMPFERMAKYCSFEKKVATNLMRIKRDSDWHFNYKESNRLRWRWLQCDVSGLYRLMFFPLSIEHLTIRFMIRLREVYFTYPVKCARFFYRDLIITNGNVIAVLRRLKLTINKWLLLPYMNI